MFKYGKKHKSRKNTPKGYIFYIGISGDSVVPVHEGRSSYNRLWVNWLHYAYGTSLPTQSTGAGGTRHESYGRISSIQVIAGSNLDQVTFFVYFFLFFFHFLYSISQ